MDADEQNRLIDRENLSRQAMTLQGSKVASTKVFSVCPDCHEILSFDGCVCQCSRFDEGHWFKRNGGWQYIPHAVDVMAAKKKDTTKGA